MQYSRAYRASTERKLQDMRFSLFGVLLLSTGFLMDMKAEVQFSAVRVGNEIQLSWESGDGPWQVQKMYKPGSGFGRIMVLRQLIAV